jgi:hypothetical protein
MPRFTVKDLLIATTLFAMWCCAWVWFDKINHSRVEIGQPIPQEVDSTKRLIVNSIALTIAYTVPLIAMSLFQKRRFSPSFKDWIVCVVVNSLMIFALL